VEFPSYPVEQIQITQPGQRALARLGTPSGSIAAHLRKGSFSAWLSDRLATPERREVHLEREPKRLYDDRPPPVFDMEAGAP